jgi:hypothetical protein
MLMKLILVVAAITYNVVTREKFKNIVFLYRPTLTLSMSSESKKEEVSQYTSTNNTLNIDNALLQDFLGKVI